MSNTRRELRLLLDSFAAREVPDGRTQVCDLDVESHGDGYAITGTVSTHSLARRLFDRVRDVPGVDRDASSLRILEDVGTTRTVETTAAPVRAAPDSDAEQVTKALYGDSVTAYDVEDGWRRVRVADGYLGWTRADAVVPAESIDPEAIVSRNVDGGENEAAPEFLPIGAPCEPVGSNDGAVTVRFRTGLEVTLPEDSINQPSGLPDGSDVTSVTERFRGTVYEWGGMTTDGIDCSGLVWVAYRVHGLELPRDADQQRLVGEDVSRDELRPGDLLFFPGHVALSLGGSRYVHAHGSSNGVVENSLDPEDEDYLADLDEDLVFCRRLVPSE